MIHPCWFVGYSHHTQTSGCAAPLVSIGLKRSCRTVRPVVCREPPVMCTEPPVENSTGGSPPPVTGRRKRPVRGSTRGTGHPSGNVSRYLVVLFDFFFPPRSPT